MDTWNVRDVSYPSTLSCLLNHSKYPLCRKVSCLLLDFPRSSDRNAVGKLQVSQRYTRGLFFYAFCSLFFNDRDTLICLDISYCIRFDVVPPKAHAINFNKKKRNWLNNKTLQVRCLIDYSSAYGSKADGSALHLRERLHKRQEFYCFASQTSDNMTATKI